VKVLGRKLSACIQLRQLVLCLVLCTIGCVVMAAQESAAATPDNAGINSAQDSPKPQKGDEKKDDAGGQEQGNEGIAHQALNKARDWESGWFTGDYIEKGQKRSPLTSKERRQIYLQQTLTRPSDYFKRMFAAGIDQARGVPQWQGGWGGYGERFASREGQFISANTLAYLGNAAMNYEPRYDRCNCSTFWPRTRHAIMRNFLTYNSSGKLRPQWALYGGSFGGGLISSTWKPDHPGPWTNATYAVLGQAGYGALLNFFVEFAADINKKIGAKHKSSRK
jgi:hypothetical protein